MSDSSHRPATRLPKRFAPSASGLPSAAALCWFPLLVAVVFVVLVALDLNGSSSGQQWNWFNAGSDPGALVGEPRPVRSDEWFVQMSWTISQFHQGFPPVNPGLPGGTDLTALHDVPTGYWTVAFRPQLWGYFFLGLSHGVAWHWWLPAALMLTAVYLFVITVNPTRPLSAAALAGTSLLTPIVQWWWQTTLFLAIGWALFALTALIWVIKDPRLSVRVWWILAAGFFAANLAFSTYVPFILTGTWVFILCTAGILAHGLRDGAVASRVLLRRVAGFALALAGAGALVLTHVYLRRDAFQAILGTAYPGQRSDPTGVLLAGGGLPLFAAPFDGALRSVQEGTALGPNQSEAATPFMIALFLTPGLVVLIIAARRASGRWCWIALSTVAATALFMAYLFIPNWDAGARLLMLDRVPAGRARVAFAVLLPISAAVTIRLAARLPDRVRWIAAALSAATVATCSIAVWLNLRGTVPNLLASDASWRVAVLLVCAGTVALFFPRLVLPGSLALLGAGMVVSAGIIPIHRGVIDLHDSEPGRAVRAINAEDPGVWVGTLFPVTTAVLVQAGVPTLNGVQSYPSLPLWRAISPSGAREENWNRVAHLDWRLSTNGGTREKLVGADHLEISMDPCSSFAQQEVDYVLVAVGSAPSQDCLEPVRTIDTAAIDLQVFGVVPPSR